MPEKQLQHPCKYDNEFRILHSDIQVLKELFGYKDKRNGEFREEVEKNEDNFANRITKLETTMQSSNQWLKINAALMGLIFTVITGILIKILI